MDPFAGALALLVGLCVGSFLNVCISRWPAGESVVAPRSRCPRCGRAITWRENIPLASWLALRGRCAGCREPISAMYPAIELAVGLGWLWSVAAFGPGLTALRVAVFGTVLLGIAVTDAKHYEIPDGFTVFGLVWVLLTALLGAWAGGWSPFAGPWDALIGACAGAGAIAIVGWLGEVALDREAMGGGDVTLMAVVGAAVGPGRALLVIFVGALLATVVFLGVVYPVLWMRRARTRMAAGAAPDDAPHAAEHAEGGGDSPIGELPLVPFGVFLAPAALLTLLWGEPLLAWYRRWLLGG